MARPPRPEHIEVRMYQVGFGDCFLLSVRYPRPLADGRAERHVLVDFGSTHSPRSHKVDMAAVAGRIAEDCGGRLDVVVVTHRHKDHLSGFANDDAALTIDELRPGLIVRPWTEAPDLAADATAPVGAASRRLLLGLNEGHAFAQQLAAAIGEHHRGLRDRVRKLADEQVKNAEAVARLDEWAAGADDEYLHAGMASKMEQVVPGMSVEVLGPPTVEQHPDVVNARARDPEYWMLYQGFVAAGLPIATLAADDHAPDDEADPDLDGADEEEAFRAGMATLARDIPAGPARWLADKLRRQQVHSLKRIVRSLDDALNNTSLILLLTIGNKRLLFPGDGQIENWRFTLDRLPKDRALRKRLGAVDLYKVGHHGSRNATPRSLVDLWGEDRHAVSLLSTRPNAHGDSEATAVPRATLVSALKERTELHSTEPLGPTEAVLVESEVTRGSHFTRA